MRLLRSLIPTLLLLGLGACKPPPPPPEDAASAIRWSDPRTWVSADGRTLEGALVARLGDDGVIRRAADGRFVRMPPTLLAEEGRTFLQQALESGKISTTHADAWYLKVRHTIPGGEAYMMPDSAAAIGPRIAKAETSYWLMLSELDLSGAFWAKVDNHTFSKLQSDTIVMRSDLSTQINAAGRFVDQVSCPRPDLYVLDARYGLTSRRINVTRAMMSHLADGTLPVTVTHELFKLPPHDPDVWDLTITWQRQGQGSLTRVIRDGSILAWPEAGASR
ncbi:MAG: hypothetical protein MUE42_02560 [Opitutaceae bacterium]|nr:hypothetical protein [Opitutaceae bacterium]